MDFGFGGFIGYYLNDKMKRKYLRIVDERVKRFVRKSE